MIQEKNNNDINIGILQPKTEQKVFEPPLAAVNSIPQLSLVEGGEQNSDCRLAPVHYVEMVQTSH